MNGIRTDNCQLLNPVVSIEKGDSEPLPIPVTLVQLLCVILHVVTKTVLGQSYVSANTAFNKNTPVKEKN